MRRKSMKTIESRCSTIGFRDGVCGRSVVELVGSFMGGLHRFYFALWHTVY
jgi:hypothetical protein